MQTTHIVLLFVILSIGSPMFCNFYPMNAMACILKTDGISCVFSQFENACLATSITSYGCVPTLNKQACLSQLTNSDGTQATCIFTKKCTAAKQQHFKHLGCSDQYSLYACMSVVRNQCLWDTQCIEFKDSIPQAETCGQVYSKPVTPSLCSQIETIRCKSGGFDQGYECVDVTDTMLKELSCNSLGLNEQSCVSILTPGQICIFENSQCKNILPSYPSKCGLALNRLGCLQITNPKLKCQWKNGQCHDFIDTHQDCGTIIEVNSSVCSNYHGICLYDQVNNKCSQPTNAQLTKITCSTFGLTQQACLQIKNYNCTFFRSVCEELQPSDLKLFQCNMLLNQDACQNIITEFQYCKWDGNACTRIAMNQDVGCPVEVNGTSTFNGNVCQAISGVLCKYNPKTKQCVQSTQMDYCDSPNLNLTGCISIARPGTACYWTKDGCTYATIVQSQTTCQSLGYANAIACSQVFESKELGCYFESSLQQCQSIVIKEESNFLNTIGCSDLSLGLNKIACASITTPGQICRWYQNQCVQIKRKEQLAQVECISLQFVNQYACGLVVYGKEFCRYLNDQKGCVNSVISPMPCDYPGLNTYGCAIATGSCYFDTTVNQCKYVNGPSGTATVSSTLLNSIFCDASSPTIDICRAIITEGQICGWSYRTNKCTNQYIPYNSLCSDFSGSNVNVNANVCASIENEFPDYDYTVDITTNINRGYCKFNIKTGNCEKNTDACTTPCCTENTKIGINAHSCSRYSDPGTYCYFGNNLRCTQLTIDQADLGNINAVKSFYNSNQFKCSQMTIKSCSMIEWSSKQRCYFNGNACINVNFTNYVDLLIFTVSPAILNKYACLAIEASGSGTDPKYFEYDVDNSRCKIVSGFTPDTYPSCEDVKGNRNICLKYTPKSNCKWDSTQLLCLTMSDQETNEIKTCSYNQNIKACLNNPNIACQFSTNSDRCIDALVNQNCSYFDDTGQVSSQVCARITKAKQMCKWNSEYKCVPLTVADTVDGCDGQGANAIACYKLTKGSCRWDSLTYQCYENQTDISSLGCSDNLNSILCLKVTKEACYWSEDQYQCLKFTADLPTYQGYNDSNLYNELACVSISGAAYQYYFNSKDSTDVDNNKCLPLATTNNNCSAYSMNKYACLMNTRGYKCYYDIIESTPNKRCKSFTDDQTSCSTSTWISIEACMQIPKQCYFNISTLSCISTTISQTQLCSSLQSQASVQYYNYLACSAVSATLSQSDGTLQCKGKDEFKQTCNYEKYCFWDPSIYTCNIKHLHNLSFDRLNKITVHQCSDLSACTADADCPSSGGGTDADGNALPVVPATCDAVEQLSPKCKNDDTTDAQYVDDCSRTYSKALCLEMSTSLCYFDLNQGGCNVLSGNQQKLPNCDSLYNVCFAADDCKTNNYCTNSITKNAICKSASSSAAYPTGCATVQRIVYTCVSNSIKSVQKCTDILNTQASQIVCASASDKCKYDGTTQACSNTLPQQDASNLCILKCDASFSVSMCDYCGCNFSSLGYCQPIAKTTPLIPILNADGSNLYYLCYEVNLLSISDKTTVCGSVAQSCKYNSGTCEDATGLPCSQLVGYTVTQRACTRCLESSMVYNSKDHSCTLLSSTVSICDNLNKKACLLMTNVNCRWINYQCTAFSSISVSDSTDCSIYNAFSCLQVANCWVDPSTQYCTPFNPLLGSCNTVSTQPLCIQSNYESCYWDIGSKKCLSTANTAFTCESANKYGCLNNADELCGWSSTLLKCTTIIIDQTKIIDCSNFLDTSYDSLKLTNFNSNVCTSLGIDKYCIRDALYRCRATVSTDILTCDIPGVNKFACVNRTTGKCKYSNSQCVRESSTTFGCDPSLNIIACLGQSDPCKFMDGTCQSFSITKLDDFINPTDIFQYSVSVCTVLDKDSTFHEPLIYSDMKQRCVSIASRSPFLSSCSYTGINYYACLQKTTVFCRYLNNNCQVVTRQALSSISQCDESLNWYACTQLSVKCKFVGGKCQSVADTEKCSDLANAFVNASVCSTRTDGACKLNSLTNNCEVVSSSQLCNTPGLNSKGCIFNTGGSKCQFLNGSCITNYDNVNCDSNVNEDKCLSIKTKGRHCFFDSKTGCQNIETEQYDLTKCGNYPNVDPLLPSITKTNPTTCSISTDKPCFYDNEATKTCIEFKTPTGSISINYDWSNNVSFNSKACQMYNLNSMNVFWNNGCIEIPATQLTYLKCTSLVNLSGCMNISTPGQYCYYKDNICQLADLTISDFKNCASNINVNSSAFCEVTTDQMCQYDSTQFACEVIQTAVKCSLITSGVDQQGYNQLACADASCSFKQHCYKVVAGTNLFCSGVATLSCNTVQNEGCKDVSGVCTQIAPDDYNIISCESAINKYGCQRIATVGQYCQYSVGKCKAVSPQSVSDFNCADLGYINSYVYCEQVSDTGCKYDQKSRQCVVVDATDELGCIRGLNALACLNNTTTSIQCLFLDYCYGPNSAILSCVPSLTTDCCLQATTIESCLYQSKFQCIWNNGCSKISNPITICNGTQNVSLSVCTSVKTEICILDTSSKQCISILPTSCDQVQSIDQCKMINTIPCYWNAELDQCLFKEKQSYDECQDIESMFGNSRACLEVERSGQMCQYQDNHCITFKEQQNVNNCLSNINKVSCTLQIQSQCLWAEQVMEIKKTSQSQALSTNVGQCSQFKSQNSTACSNNLSYLSCLNITKIGAFCMWIDEQCQQIVVQKTITFSIQSLNLVNSNACGLVNDGSIVVYNSQTSSCIKVTDSSVLTCSPAISGINKQGCLSIKTQKCKWDDGNSLCLFYGKRLLIEEQIGQLRLLPVNSCKQDGLGAKLCAQIADSSACGSVGDGCDSIDVNTAKCEDKGLNQYSCLHLTTGPCSWVPNTDDSFYHCANYIPYSSCKDIIMKVNAIVCTFVQEDACVFSLDTSQCEIPSTVYNKCDILGINAIGCSQINGCIFMNQQCVQQVENVNLLCGDIPQANYQVCSSAIDRCKYSDLTYGCIKSTITDNCNTLGISSLGCNVLDGCKWDDINNNCQCLAYLSKYPLCSSITVYLDCVNLDYCYFEISKSATNKDITQYLKNSNYGVCRQKTCNDFGINQCQGSYINADLCYLTMDQKCQTASKCEEITQPSQDCSLYNFNNKPCFTNISKSYCESLNCSTLDSKQCSQFPKYCVFTGTCKRRTCEYMGQLDCLQNDCDWNDISQKCTIQLDCSQITTSDRCMQKKQQQIQCAWIATLNSVEECTPTGCRFLGVSQGDCMGTHIGTDVCVQMRDFSCVSCEEISDSCVCLQQSQFCSFDKYQNKCFSNSCQTHNEDDCPTTHCRFNNTDKICQPMCQYNYNQLQCNQADECVWDTVNKICTSHLKEEIIVQIILPSPNWQSIVSIFITLFLLQI